MTESLTMNQVIHGAVRRDLDRLATALERLRDGDRDRAQGLAMGTLARSGSADDAATARASVVRTRVVVDGHLGHEEDELEPQLRPHLESPEWRAVEKKLSRQSPGVAGGFFAWLTDGMSDDHRAFLKGTVPAPVVTVLARVFGRRYNREVAPVWRES